MKACLQKSNKKIIALSACIIALVLTLSSCAELVSRDDLDNIYGGTAVVDGDKIWLGEEFDRFTLSSVELTSVSDQSAFRADVAGKTLFYVNVGNVKRYPLVCDSASTLYGSDYKIAVDYKWGDGKTVIPHASSDLNGFVSATDISVNGCTVKYTDSIELSYSAFESEAASRGLTSTENAKNLASSVFDSEFSQKRELTVRTAPGYYCYSVCADFAVYAVFSYDPVTRNTEYTYIFLPFESSVVGTYARGESKNFTHDAGNHQLIAPNEYRLSQLMPDVFGANSSDTDNTPIATYVFSDTNTKVIYETGSFGLGLGSERDLLDLSEFAQYMNGEYEFRFTVNTKCSLATSSLLFPSVCDREFCLYDRMPPADGVTGTVSEETARETYGLIAYESDTMLESVGDVQYTWTILGDRITQNMYLVYNAARAQGSASAVWNLDSISITVEIIRK